MNDFLTLRLLDFLKPVLLKMNVNVPVLRLIVHTKLTMDRRKTPPAYLMNQTRPERNKEESEAKPGLAGLLKNNWLYLLLGAIGITPFLLLGGEHFMLPVGLAFGVLLFMLTTTMISDFSSVMLDIRDRNILSTKPIDGRTLAMAKTVHILSYLVTLTFSLTIIPLAAALFRRGIAFFLLFLLMIAVALVFVVVLTALLYLLVLRFFDGEKLKDMINYVQIALSIGLTIGYQLLIRVFDFVDLGAAFTVQPWQYALPPLWFAAPFQLLLRGDTGTPILILSALSLAVPALCLFAYLRYGGNFERYLHKMAAGDSGDGTRPGRRRLGPLLERFVSPNPNERTFYKFAARMVSREREFKLKVYPLLGLAVVFPFVLIFNSLSGSSWSEVAGSRMYLGVYLAGLFMPSAVRLLRYSGNYKGAYIYQVAPIGDWNDLYRGALKAAIIRLFLPLLLLQGAIFIAIFGWRIVPDLICVLLVVCLHSVISFRIYDKGLPFSESFQDMRKESVAQTLPLMFILLGFALLHYLALQLPFGLYGYAALLAAANVWAWRRGLGLKGREVGV